MVKMYNKANKLITISHDSRPFIEAPLIDDKTGL